WLVSGRPCAARRLGDHRAVADAGSLRLPEDERERLRPPHSHGLDAREPHLRRWLPRLRRDASNAATRPAARNLNQTRPPVAPGRGVRLRGHPRTLDQASAGLSRRRRRQLLARVSASIASPWSAIASNW